MNFLDNVRSTLQPLSMLDLNLVNENYLKLNDMVSEGDRHLFPTNMMDMDVEEMVEIASKGWRCLKKYKLNEDETQVEHARRRIKL